MNLEAYIYTNGRSTLKYCLSSLQEQTVLGKISVFKNQNLLVALNKTLETTQATHFVKIDDDFVLHPRALEYMWEQFQNFEDMKKVGLYCCQLWEDWTHKPIMGVKIYSVDLLKQIGGFFSDKYGKVDLESIDALDIRAFKENMNELSEKGFTKIPSFDFPTATRRPELIPISLKNDEVLIIEGIHGLNPLMTEGIRDEHIFKIYISALTTINIDNHNRFSTTDTRLIRRITRDYQYRNASASHTLHMWESVRSGEDKYIFPFQEQADVIFNSALLYEHGLLRNIAESILRKVKKDDSAYCESRRLLDILSAFERIDSNAVPPSSIIREFIGGSCFH